jgi:hypothetical protein
MAPKGSEIMLDMYEKCLAELQKHPDRYQKIKHVDTHIRTLKQASRGKSSSSKTKKNIGLQSYHWPGGSKLLERLITQYNLDKWIRDPEFAFPVNWWDFRYIFQSVPNDRIPASRGWTEDTRLDHILEDKKTALVVIHNGWIKNQGLDKNAKYPPDSFFERLDRFVND